LQRKPCAVFLAHPVHTVYKQKAAVLTIFYIIVIHITGHRTAYTYDQ